MANPGVEVSLRSTVFVSLMCFYIDNNDILFSFLLALNFTPTRGADMNVYSAWVISAAIALWQAAGIAGAADAKRQHEAHVHGAGTLNLVQEGKQLHVELDIPGMDLVGFEHQARTADQKKAVQDAVATLKKGDAVFRINAAAKCSIDSAEVHVALLDDEHDGDHGNEAGDALTRQAGCEDHGSPPTQAKEQVGGDEGGSDPQERGEELAHDTASFFAQEPKACWRQGLPFRAWSQHS